MHLRLGLLGDVVGERLAVGLHFFEGGAVEQCDGHAGFLGDLRLPSVLLFFRLVGGVLGFKLFDVLGCLFGFGQLGLLELLQFVGGCLVVLGAFLPFTGMGDGLPVFGLVIDFGRLRSVLGRCRLLVAVGLFGHGSS